MSDSNSKGTLHLVPNILADQGHYAIPSYLVPIVSSIKIWYVEEIKSARRFLKAMNKEINIDELIIFMLNEHENASLSFVSDLLNQGKDIGMISEAGCPSVADPGNLIVQIAHQIGAKVKPHIGPNSILLALMASGFNGQHFQFHGYLPNKQPALGQKILELEKESRISNKTQLFIETPYRNDQLIREIIKVCHSETKLCVASDLTGINEKVVSSSLQKWKNLEFTFHKIPAVFVIYAGI